MNQEHNGDVQESIIEKKEKLPFPEIKLSDKEQNAKKAIVKNFILIKKSTVRNK